MQNLGHSFHRCGGHGLAYDRTPPRKKAFEAVKRAEIIYARALRAVARQIGMLVQGLWDETPESVRKIEEALFRYAETVEGWAKLVGERMVLDVAARDARAWKATAEEIGRLKAHQIANTPIGARMRQLVEEQVHLIKSLPLEAAQRAQEMAIETQWTGQRFTTIAEKILATGHVTVSRANLIARTEVGRCAQAITQARAESFGSSGYIWRTAHDGDVRPSHRKMDGKFVAWDDPPTLDGLTGQAGALPNCRCWCEPVIPD